MISLFTEKNNCYGCTACKNICPKQAIAMDFDHEGFLYPKIDKMKCIECGLCNSVCPYKNDVVLGGHFDKPKVYAMKHKNVSVRMASSSGGAYTAISDFILKQNGICYGVAFDDRFYVKHICATNIGERNELMGSKYVQSDLGNCFSEIKQALEKGKIVLFTGTPCQTAGLVQYLCVSGVDTTNLMLNDIICHGTPSPLLWKDYIELIEKKYRAQLTGFTFRCKDKGWRGYNVRANFSDGSEVTNTKQLLYHTNLFKVNLCLRPVCYNCKYANVNRVSDITIGDFWGIEKFMQNFDDDKGVSLVLLNTANGARLFDEIKNDTVYLKGNLSNCMQLNLYQPSKMPTNREAFWKDYHRHGYNYIVSKYAKQGITKKFKSYLKVLRNLSIKIFNK